MRICLLNCLSIAQYPRFYFLNGNTEDVVNRDIILASQLLQFLIEYFGIAVIIVDHHDHSCRYPSQ